MMTTFSFPSRYIEITRWLNIHVLNSLQRSLNSVQYNTCKFIRKVIWHPTCAFCPIAHQSLKRAAWPSSTLTYFSYFHLHYDKSSKAMSKTTTSFYVHYTRSILGIVAIHGNAQINSLMMPPRCLHRHTPYRRLTVLRLLLAYVSSVLYAVGFPFLLHLLFSGTLSCFLLIRSIFKSTKVTSLASSRNHFSIPIVLVTFSYLIGDFQVVSWLGYTSLRAFNGSTHVPLFVELCFKDFNILFCAACFQWFG